MRSKNKNLILLFMFIIPLISCKREGETNNSEPTIEKANYYVSPEGNDDNPGTFDQPFKSVEQAYSVAKAGDLVYFRGGRYFPKDPSLQIAINLTKNRHGRADSLIRFWNYPGETPVIDLSTLSYTGTGKIDGFKFTGNYWWWKGFEITGFPNKTCDVVQQSCFLRDCNYCTFENFKVHDNYSLGIALGGAEGNLCTGNTLKNCDGYRNQDPNTTSDPSGNSDGIHITIADSTGVNYVIGCRMWDNSDDGFDSFNSVGLIEISDCWAFHNGFAPGTETVVGDGNGFKFGQTPSNRYTVRRIVTNCIATTNRGHGFDSNFSTYAFPIHLFNCTSYKNGKGNNGFGIRLVSNIVQHKVQNCIAYDNQYTGSVGTLSIHDHNTWDTPNIMVNDDDFISLDLSLLTSERQPDGELPKLDVLRLKVGSDLIGAGTNTGYGSNIGAY